MNYYYMDFDPHLIRERNEEMLEEVRSVRLEEVLREYGDQQRKEKRTMGTMASIKEGALNLRGVVLLLMTMGMALLLASGVAHAAAPTNDNFADAQQIIGANATLTGTNVDATKESGEPNHVNNAGGKSVWYYWTPLSNGDVTIDTAGSPFDTLLAVYTGSAVNALTEVASNDDENDLSGLGIVTSKVSFTVTAGTTYRIAVDGFNNGPGAESGSITLNLASNTTPPDTTAPDAPVISAPGNNSYNTSGNITLSGTAEANSTVQIFEVTASGPASKGTTSVDSGGTWSKRLIGVPDGSHTYKAKAIDVAGNISSYSEGCKVIVDTVHPKVIMWRPGPIDIEKNDGYKLPGADPRTNVSAAFSEAMRAGSVKQAFHLYKKGSDAPIRAIFTYNQTTNNAVLNPDANLERGATYKAVVTTAAKDLAGNALDMNPRETGDQPLVWFFTISS